MTNSAKNQDQVLAELSAEGLLRLIADASPMFIAYVDAKQRFRFANKTYAEAFGRPLKEIIGKPVKEIPCTSSPAAVAHGSP